MQYCSYLSREDIFESLFSVRQQLPLFGYFKSRNEGCTQLHLLDELIFGSTDVSRLFLRTVPLDSNEPIDYYDNRVRYEGFVTIDFPEEHKMIIGPSWLVCDPVSAPVSPRNLFEKFKRNWKSMEVCEAKENDLLVSRKPLWFSQRAVDAYLSGKRFTQWLNFKNELEWDPIPLERCAAPKCLIDY